MDLVAQAKEAREKYSQEAREASGRSSWCLGIEALSEHELFSRLSPEERQKKVDAKMAVVNKILN